MVGAGVIYLTGSLRDDKVPAVAGALRREGIEVHDDWHAAGPHADDEWKRYERQKGHNLVQALAGEAAKTVFNFDKRFMHFADAGVLVAPAGRSAHLEIGWMAGQGKPTFVLLSDDPERWDVMYQFCTAVFEDVHQLIEKLRILDIA